MHSTVQQTVSDFTTWTMTQTADCRCNVYSQWWNPASHESSCMVTRFRPCYTDCRRNDIVYRNYTKYYWPLEPKDIN